MNNKMIFISEAFIPTVFGWNEQQIGENKHGPIMALIMEGEFQRAEAPNRNKRVYSEQLLGRETTKLQQFIAERNGLPMGMDHPLPGDTERDMILIQRMGMNDACALCKNLEMNNKIVYGKSQVLQGDNGSGDKLAAMLKAGFKPGVSSRGIGGKPTYSTHNASGYIMVPEDYNMITYDVVSQPSTFNAILEQRVNEELMMFESQKSYVRKLWDVMVELKEKHK
jgi:hypothetical protein